MTPRWLEHIFNGDGNVIDVYISYKRRNNNGKVFGFV